MSDIEGETIPILEPMVTFENFNRTIGLSPRDQSVLARWAYKTALVLEFSFPKPPWIPTSWYADFYRRRWPPQRGVVIWLTTYGGFQRAVHTYFRTSTIFPEGPDGRPIEDAATHTKAQLITFSVYRLVFQVLLFFGGEWQPSLSHAWDPISFKIWPLEGEMINWPKSRDALDLSGMIRFSQREDFF